MALENIRFSIDCPPRRSVARARERTSMQAGLVTGKRRVELVDFAEPQPEPGKSVVQVRYCGICGTDLHAYLSGDPYNPAICGHEWTGTVSAVGTTLDGAASGWREGDRVAVGVAAACGRCATCRRGDAAHCETAFAGAIGIHPLAAPHGGFASAIACDNERLYAIKREISDAEAAILEPVTVAVHAVRRTPLRLGDTVIVIGAGPIGLLVLQAARAAGAGRVLVLEPSAARQAIARELGAALVIDPTAFADTPSLSEAINAGLGAAGADVVFECAGIPQTIQTAVDLCRRGGVVSLVGVPSLPAQINAASWLVKEVRVATAIAYVHEEFELAQSLVQDGRINAGRLHTQTVNLNGLDQAFDALAANPQEIKILVDPRG